MTASCLRGEELMMLKSCCVKLGNAVRSYSLFAGERLLSGCLKALLSSVQLPMASTSRGGFSEMKSQNKGI